MTYQDTVQTIKDNATDDGVPDFVAAADLWDQAQGHLDSPGMMTPEVLADIRRERDNCALFLRRHGFSKIDGKVVDTILAGQFED